MSLDILLVAEREKVRQRGSGAESRARALRADQGLYKAKLESNSEPERARVSQRVAESQCEPEWES